MSTRYVETDPNNPLRFKYEVDGQTVIVSVIEEAFDDFYRISTESEINTTLGNECDKIIVSIAAWLEGLAARIDLQSEYQLNLTTFGNIMRGANAN